MSMYHENYHAEVKILRGYISIMILQVQRDFGGKKWFHTSRAVDDQRKRRVRFSDQRRNLLVARDEENIQFLIGSHCIGM